ncbi:tubulin polyglutamylase TTLL7-like isoform X2 [Tubulanus polymorphus]|uniref:tubulin polyglutamylase TTLL7-like isoform X2 n=1 Tax=Tubulanus polymorphus TaxID=672921 RepID=UPI003DA236CA
MFTLRGSSSMSSIDKEVALNALNTHKRKSKELPPKYEHVTLEEPSKHKRKKKRKNPITVNLGGTRYEIIRHVTTKAGFTLTKEDDPNSYLIWNDCFVSTERIAELKPYQRINHFPSMGEICRKDSLARNMAKMSKAHPDEYNFTPKTWIFPNEYNAFMNYTRDLKKKRKTKTYITKPVNGAMGNGIQLYRNSDKIPQSEHIIVQEYIDKPFLIDGYKTDLRIYVLVTSCDPLRIFLFEDGLVRISTEKYLIPHESNIEHLYMHLTNYSINKHSDTYEKGDTTESGSKRSLRFLNEYLRKNDFDVAHLWRSISEIIIKTLIIAEPQVLHAYRMCRPGQAAGSDSVCFEVFGFDIMLDRKLKPWLLEINRSPSFGTDERIDYQVKSSLLEDTIRLLNIRASDKKRNIAAQKAEAQRRLFRPHKRSDGDLSEYQKKRIVAEKKKDELKELLGRIRRETAREDYENRNIGRFRRIFPPEDKFKQERFAHLINEAFSLFLSGRSGALQKEITMTYSNRLREEDVLDMLSQVEADENDGRILSTRSVGPKPLSSMPTYQASVRSDDESDSDEDEDDIMSMDGTTMTATDTGVQPSLSRSHTTLATTASQKSQQNLSRSNNNKTSRPGSEQAATRPGGRGNTGQRSRSLPRPGSSRAATIINQTLNEINLNSLDREDGLLKKTLISLNEMRIKFPGKSDEEAEWILDKLHENWKFHKPRVASYWLVKLDSIKRRKVVDIVRSNVRAVLQRTWKVPDIENLRLYRIFGRVFNRLLWSHGQGLWNCFSQSGNSWETIFSKSTDVIAVQEMNCCRRIVELCKDCLLIVYQFAADAKGASHPPETESDAYSTNLRGSSSVTTANAKLRDRQNGIASPHRFRMYYQQPKPGNTSGNLSSIR